jgi:hypothetical protein
MEGVTTALVLFLFVCVVFPNLIRNKAQYYAGLVVVCLIILLEALGAMSPEGYALRVVTHVLGALLQVAAIVLLFLAAGGITWRELADDMKDAYEVIRRGQEEKEIIIPLSGDFARQRRTGEAESRERIEINDPPRPEDRPPGSPESPDPPPS